MKSRSEKIGRRPGFTLVETLIVIAIIAVLIAMLLPVIFGVRRKAKETETRTEITQLSAAIQAFQTDYRVPYVPSFLILCENEADYLSLPGVSSLSSEPSYQYLKRLWPRLTFPVDWNGNGSTNDPPVFLQGDQCLVFFLGGIPVPPSSGSKGTQGFSTNVANPTQPGGNRKGPYFVFEEYRLIDIHANGFYSYQDPYRNTPNSVGGIFGVYAYFSSYGRANGYRKAGEDCALLQVSAYANVADTVDSSKWRYLNPTTFQIISAGADGQFGKGSWSPQETWTPGTANSSTAILGYSGLKPSSYKTGADDISNFYDKLLGVSE